MEAYTEEISIFFCMIRFLSMDRCAFSHLIKQTKGIHLKPVSTSEASHSRNITHNPVYNQCCTVCRCPEGASTQNIVCHYVLLGLEVGDNSVEKCYFQKQSFSTQQCHFLCILLCEISDVRAFVTGFIGVSSRRGKLHSQKTSANFQSFALSHPPFKKLLTLTLCTFVQVLYFCLDS